MQTTNPEILLLLLMIINLFEQHVRQGIPLLNVFAIVFVNVFANLYVENLQDTFTKLNLHVENLQDTFTKP